MAELHSLPHTSSWRGAHFRFKSALFWDITTCIPVEVRRRQWTKNKPTRKKQLHNLCSIRTIVRMSKLRKCNTHGRCPFHVLLLSTLKMEAVRASETSVGFYRTIKRCIPEEATLLTRSYRCERLKFKNFASVLSSVVFHFSSENLLHLC
jgi:hypothetical protein